MFEFHYCEPFGRFPTVAAQFPDEDAALVAGMLHLAIQLNEPVPPEGACNVFYLPGGVEGVNVAFILTPTRPGAPGGGVVLLEDS